MEVSYLQDSLIVDLVENSAVDLVGFECGPVEHRQAKFGLDGLLYPDGCRPMQGVTDESQMSQRGVSDKHWKLAYAINAMIHYPGFIFTQIYA